MSKTTDEKDTITVGGCSVTGEPARNIAESISEAIRVATYTTATVVVGGAAVVAYNYCSSDTSSNSNDTKKLSGESSNTGDDS